MSRKLKIEDVKLTLLDLYHQMSETINIINKLSMLTTLHIGGDWVSSTSL